MAIDSVNPGICYSFTLLISYMFFNPFKMAVQFFLTASSYSSSEYLNFLAIGYVTHSFFFYLGISNFNWVFKISKKCLFAYFAFFNWVFW